VRSGLVVGARDLTPTGGTADGGLASSGSTLGPIPPGMRASVPLRRAPELAGGPDR